MNFKPKKKQPKLDPDEIFLDSSNLPLFDTQQFEGQLEKPITKHVLYLLVGVFGLGLLIFLGKIFDLQINQGQAFAERSENNTLRYTIIPTPRGVIYDREEVELGWNNPDRVYRSEPGLSHIVGYLGYQTEAQADPDRPDYNPQELVGQDGVERVYNDKLRGQTGVKIEETNVRGEIQSEYLLHQPIPGENLTLSIDSRVQEKLFQTIAALAKDRGFSGGAGVLIDVKTGELRALASYPEYDANNIIDSLKEPGTPFLNRAVAGLYTPGSIIKPVIAIGALTEKVIDPSKKILSTGALTLPNPFLPDQPSIFRDWKAHGWVDMRHALAVSSDVYFYEVGGGFEDQKGLGIANIDKYSHLFGLGETTGFNWPHEEEGNIPTPEWKEENFDGDPWRIGDTYHTAIGQYGFQVTPLQMARVVGAIATGGDLITPTILVASSSPLKQPGRDLRSEISADSFQIVREGMRLSVLEGTAAGLNVPAVEVAAKTGTAELGLSKDNVNSWVIGFFPYEAPRFAFAVVMERGHHENTIGGVFVVRQLLDWLAAEAPEYFTH